MKTSVIRYRVADFLREHPPFDLFSLEDLLSFSGTGRVAFHEDDIYLFRKGDARDQVVRVIQQGKVEIIDETTTGENLRDLLGPGDILGLGLLPAVVEYSHTARTATEAIIYSFDLNSFNALIDKYPDAALFLNAHISATARRTRTLQATAGRDRLITEKEKSVWLMTADLPADWATKRLLTCDAEHSLSDVASRMMEERGDVVAVVSPSGSPLGLITDEEIRNHTATGAASSASTAESVMNRRFPTAAPGLKTADYLLEMMRGRSRTLAITQDGAQNSVLQGIISDSDLAISCGRNPLLIIREMLDAATVADLAYLRKRASIMSAEGLAGPSLAEWFAQMLAEVNSALVERVVRIAENEMERAGRVAPGLQSCWLFFGRAGRRELLSAEAPEIGVLYADPPAEKADEAGKYFSTLAQKVSAKLLACGLRDRRRPPTNAAARSQSEWYDFYAALIRDPIQNEIYYSREYFDFSPAAGDQALSLELEKTILAEMAENDSFIPVLANDTISSLPPLTFFDGFIIDQDGARKDSLDIEKTVLAPIIDSARVFAFAEKDISDSNTLRRLATSARISPEYASILNDAAEAWRIVAYHDAVAGISKQSGGEAVHPPRMSRFEQRLLKSAFDSIRRFLELTNSIYSSHSLQ